MLSKATSILVFIRQVMKLKQIRILSGASQVVLVVKNLPANAGDARDMGLIPGSGRSPGEGNGNPLPHAEILE